MQPVSRANLNHICCICLLDVRPSMFNQKVYDIKKENNMSQLLKITALITILKNPINHKYVSDYCRKVCEICYVKIQYSYCFREKIIASTVALKELLESNNLNKEDIERLEYFCRICLNRLNATKDIKYLNMEHKNWLKDCTGIRFTSLIDTETFRIKEGTNINEIAVINDESFPQQLCTKCFKKLENVEEFRKSATQSFQYMISVMGDGSGPEDYLQVSPEINKLKENIVCSNAPHLQLVTNDMKWRKQDCAILDIDNFEYEKEQRHSVTVIESMITSSNSQYLENDNFEVVMDLMEPLPNYSDNSDEELNLNFDKFLDCSDNSYRKTGVDKTDQCKVNNDTNLKASENVENEKTIKSKLRRFRNGKQLDKSIKTTYIPSQKITRQAKHLKENETSHNGIIKYTKESFVCEECSEIFSTRYTYKRHKKSAHQYNTPQTMHECLICSKKFKRKSHLTDHIKTVHEKLRPFKCSHCTKTFSANSSKRVHELTHTGDYPSVCKWCGKGFRRASQLNIHIEIHTTNPELLCPICKRSQKSSLDLENHLKSHNDNRLQCPLCGKFFTRSYHLKDHHNAVHLKLRPFKCEFCELAFGDRKTRRIHEKSHTEDRPVTCGVCKSGFKTHFSLSRHINQFGHKTENYENKNKTKKKTTKKSISSHYGEEVYINCEP